MDELHAIFVGTHSVGTHDQTSESVRSLSQGSHRSIMLWTHHSRAIRNNFGACGKSLPRVIRGGEHRRLLSVGNHIERKNAAKARSGERKTIRHIRFPLVVSTLLNWPSVALAHP
jgi:hypothetical protein